jgi:hypothetical protein
MNQLLVFGVVLGITVSNPSAHISQNTSIHLDRTASSIVLDSSTDPDGDNGGAVTANNPSTGSEVDSGNKPTPILL